MKEQRIIVEIDQEGRLSAEAEGFSGDACLQALDRLLEDVVTTPPQVTRKPDSEPARSRLTTTTRQQVKR